MEREVRFPWHVRVAVLFIMLAFVLVIEHQLSSGLRIVDSIQESDTIRYAYVGDELPALLEEGEVKERRTESSYTVYLGKNEEGRDIYRTRTYTAPAFVRDGLAWHTVEYGTDTQENFLAKTRPSTLSRIARAIVPPTYAVTIFSGSGDGAVGCEECEVTWDPLHDRTSADAFNGGANAVVGGWSQELYRLFLPFDTSSIPSGATITAGTLNVYVLSKLNEDNDGNDFITVVRTSQATHTTLASEDFDQAGATNNPTEGHDAGQRKDITSISTGAYLTFTLNATGFGWIAKSGVASNCSATTGITCLGIRTGHDALDHEPAGTNFVDIYLSERTGTSQDPYLDITYTEASYPVVEATNASESTSGSFNVSLPAGIQAGELLIVHVTMDAWEGQTIATPGGWSLLANVLENEVRSYVFYKTASGSEGGTLALTITGTASGTSHESVRISSWSGTPEITSVGGSGTVPNPPSETASWGSDDNLFIAVGSGLGNDDFTLNFTAAPTNYSGLVGDIGFNVSGAMAFRELTSASDDPGAWTVNYNPYDWVASTIVVRYGEEVAIPRPIRLSGGTRIRGGTRLGGITSVPPPAASCGAGEDIGGGECRVFLTSTTTTSWIVPDDWNDADNTIEAIGGGGGTQSIATAEYGGGGGGAYSRVDNIDLTPSANITIQVGRAGQPHPDTPTNGGDSYFNGASCLAATVCAKGGKAPDTGNTDPGAGGLASEGVGTIKYDGGNPGPDEWGLGAGGGAAGPGGAGQAGSTGDTASGGDEAGSGGGGAGGGSATAGSMGGDTGGAGGQGPAGTGSGAGGNAAPGSPGSNGGGGGGGDLTFSGGAGGDGTEWGSYGAGGGGGAKGLGATAADGGPGGLYGGGAGAGGAGSAPGARAGEGGQGIIVITYTPI